MQLTGSKFKSQIKKHSTLQHKTKIVVDRKVTTQLHYNFWTEDNRSFFFKISEQN
jgi:hypothetical protein